MKALILQNDAEKAIITARAMLDNGFKILCAETLSVAHALIRIENIDIIVMDEQIAGQSTYAVALSSERRNPRLNVILTTDRRAADTDDLYDLMPSLYAAVGTDITPDLLGQLAISARGDAQTTLQDKTHSSVGIALDDRDVMPAIMAKSHDVDDDDESGAPSFVHVSRGGAEIPKTQIAELTQGPMLDQAAGTTGALQQTHDDPDGDIMADITKMMQKHTAKHAHDTAVLADQRAS